MKVASAVLAASALLLATSLPAQAGGSIFPLEPGWAWTYLGDIGGSAQLDIGGTQLVRGRLTTVRHNVHVDVLNGQSFDNYWTADVDGKVYLHGFTNFTFNLVFSYEPPLLWLAPPLYVGKTWSTTSQRYEGLDGNVPSGAPFTFAVEVLSEQDIVVPAGTVHAFEIGLLFAAPLQLSTLRFDALGQRLDTATVTGNSNDWYSPGIGLVRFLGAEHYDLVSYGHPLPVTPQSWAAVKDLYRR